MKAKKLSLRKVAGGTFAMFTVLAVADAHGGVVTYNFGSTGSLTLAPTSNTATNVTGGSFSIGNTFGTVTAATELSVTSPSSGYTGASGTGNLGTAVGQGATLNTSTSAYYQVQVTAASGYSLTLSEVDFGTRSTSTGPSAFAIYYATDAFATPANSVSLATGTQTTTSAWGLKTSAFTPVTVAAGTTLTLRIYEYGSGATNQGSGSVDSRIDDVAITATANSTSANLSWTGATDRNWNTTAQNFTNTNTSSAATYAEGNAVTFSDTGAGSVIVASGGVTPLSTAFTNNTGNDYVFTGGAINGSGGLTKSGTGTVTLSNAANTFTGATALSAGTLILNTSLASSAVAISSTATLQTGSLAAVGSLVVNNGGTLNVGGTAAAGTLNAGSLVVNSGAVLAVDAGQDLVNLGSGNLQVLGGTVNYSGSATVGTAYTLVSAATNTGSAGNFVTGTKPTGVVGGSVYAFSGGAYTVTFENQGLADQANYDNLNSETSPYTQNFNSLPSSGTTLAMSTLPQGFAFAKLTSGTVTYEAGTGSGTTGDVYSFATTASPSNHALGSLTSATTGTIVFGLNLKNNTGADMNQLNVTYTGKQFRYGGGTTSTNKDALVFQYSADATSINDTSAHWTEVSALDFYSLVYNGASYVAADGSTGTAAAAALVLDGNSEAQVLSASVDLTGAPIIAGNGFWLRWVDSDLVSISDDGLGIDDLSVTPEPGTIALAGIAGTGLLLRRRRSRTLKV